MKKTQWTITAFILFGAVFHGPAFSETPPSLGFNLIPLNQLVSISKKLWPTEAGPYPGACRWLQAPKEFPVLQDLSHFSSSGQVNIDFSAPVVSKPSMNGFLAALSDLESFRPSTGLVPDSKVMPLSPGLWTIAAVNGLIQNIGISNYFGATPEVPVWGAWADGTPPPYADLAAWKQNVQALITAGASPTQMPAAFGQNVIWEVWNEPDCQYEWGAQKFGAQYGPSTTFQNLFDTYQAAYQVFRSLPGGPSEIIAGLRWNAYNRDVIGTFLEYCLSNHLEVNALVWHELGQSRNNLPMIASHLNEARSLFVNNPRYAPLKIKKIIINETTQANPFPALGLAPTINCGGGKGQICYQPSGEIIATNYFLELGGADKAAEGNYMTVAPNNTLGGLLDPETQAPLAPWWAEKTYADLGTERIPCNSNNQQIICLATPASKQTGLPEILVAYYGPVTAPSTLNPVTITISLKNLPSYFSLGNSHLGADVQLIPSGKEGKNADVLTLPVQSLSPTRNPDGSYLITLQAPLSLDSAARIRLTNGHPLFGNMIFTTRQTYNGNLGGVSQANSICTALAKQNGLMQSHPWSALIASDGQPLQNIAIGSGPFWNSQNQKVADNSTSLFFDTLQNSISYDEAGTLVSSSGTADTWTGSGVWGGGVKRTCQNWTSSDSSLRGTIGISSELDYWTTDNSVYADGQTANCGRNMHLYCVSQ